MEYWYRKVKLYPQGLFLRLFLIKRLSSCIRFHPCSHRLRAKASCYSRLSALQASLGELAAMAGLQIPKDLKRDKGWIGMLLELWLGQAPGASQSKISRPLA